MKGEKHIWIVNFHTAPPEFVSQPRYIKLVPFLTNAGYKVTVICQSYLRKQNIEFVDKGKHYISRTYGDYNFIHIKSPKYKGNGFGRMLSIFIFSIKLHWLRNRFERPNIILHNIHAPFDYPVVFTAEKLNARYFVEAWDLWPDSFVRFGLISANNPLAKLAYSLERKMYEKSEKIIFTMEGGADYLKDRKWTTSTGGVIDNKKIVYINNGIDVSGFENDALTMSLHDKDLENNSLFKVVYMGSISLVNDVIQLVEAFRLLAIHPTIKLLVYGDGSQRESLEKYVAEQNLNNIIFKQKRIPLSHVPYVLSNASLNILNYQKGFGKYGISSGKFFQSLGSGKPIVCNTEINYDLITKHQLGVCENLDTPKKYADAIMSIYNLNDKDYDSMCSRVKEVAMTFDYKYLSKTLINALR
jgi:glycosyltransferase involved in cell wall biosynthesis